MYVRVHPQDDREYLVVGGEYHKSGQADDATERHAGSRPGRDGSFRR